MALETAANFFLASIILALAPGPDNIFVVTHSVMRGREAGIAVVMGLCSGLVIHTSMVALGVAVIFQTSTWAFTGLKLLGAVYLLYLAWQALTAGSVTAGVAEHQPSLLWSYRRGIIMNLTNPKVSLFFLAFLPQFIQPAVGSVTWQLFLLGGLFIAATVIVFGSLALLAGRVAHLLKNSFRFQKGLNWAAALVFIALAVNLLISSTDMP